MSAEIVSHLINFSSLNQFNQMLRVNINMHGNYFFFKARNFILKMRQHYTWKLSVNVYIIRIQKLTLLPRAFHRSSHKFLSDNTNLIRETSSSLLIKTEETRVSYWHS